MGEVIQIHVGQAGIQIANACWEIYCMEHGINENGCMPLAPKDDAYKNFFSITNSIKVVPRVIMVDTEPTVLDEVRTGPCRNLFHPDTLISGKEDTGSNYARGFHTLGNELIECTMENIRRIAEKSSNLRGFLIFRAVGGGTGSGFGNLIVNRLNSDYGKRSKVEFMIFPSPSLSPLVVEPYNAMLCCHSKGITTCDCSFIIDNEALYEICARRLDIHAPTYEHINRIIGQVVSSFTASMRFQCNASLTFAEFPTNLVPFPKFRFPLVSYAPLVNPAKISYSALTTEDLTYEVFLPTSQLAKCNPNKGKYMACVLLYRGDIAAGEAHTSVNTVKKHYIDRFVDWSPTGFKIGINSMTPCFYRGSDIAPTNRTLLCLTNSTAIHKPWCRVLSKCNKLLSRRAFIHQFLSEGIEEDAINLASTTVCDLIKEYQRVNNLESPTMTQEVSAKSWETEKPPTVRIQPPSTVLKSPR